VFLKSNSFDSDDHNIGNRPHDGSQINENKNRGEGVPLRVVHLGQFPFLKPVKFFPPGLFPGPFIAADGDVEENNETGAKAKGQHHVLEVEQREILHRVSYLPNRQRLKATDPTIPIDPRITMNKRTYA
jgi:hypothetical protein